MRATELTMVLEDDEHHEHVIRFEGDDAEIGRAILASVAIIGDNPKPSFEGRVLRKVTEVEGHVGWAEYNGVRRSVTPWPELESMLMGNLLPAIEGDVKLRITVEAVPVTKKGETP